MSVDLLQEKIRKTKNPSVIDFTAGREMIPTPLLEQEESFLSAYGVYCTQLLDALQGLVPAVRFRFSNFTLLGQEGLHLLQQMLACAYRSGFYVLLDCVDILSPQMAHMAADTLFSDDNLWQFHGLVVSTYIGSDGLKPFIKKLSGTGKGIFGVIRTGNKSASELQDLLSGNRLSHAAAADLVNRLGEPLPARCGYNQVGAMAGASSADGLRALRAKYSRVFLLLDGYDYPNANAKNCSFAFDKLGHGAAACAGESVLAAWKEGNPADYIEYAVEAAQRMKKNLSRYVTVL